MANTVFFFCTQGLTRPIGYFSDVLGWTEVALQTQANPQPPTTSGLLKGRLSHSIASLWRQLAFASPSIPWPLTASQSYCQLFSQSAAAQQHQAWLSLTLPPSRLSTLRLSNYCQCQQRGRTEGRVEIKQRGKSGWEKGGVHVLQDELDKESRKTYTVHAHMHTNTHTFDICISFALFFLMLPLADSHQHPSPPFLFKVIPSVASVLLISQCFQSPIPPTAHQLHVSICQSQSTSSTSLWFQKWRGKMGKRWGWRKK